MTNKNSKGYTKSTVGKFDLHSMLTNDVFKSKDEPFESWFNRKVSEQINGGTDEKVMSRKGDNQNPNPSFCKHEHITRSDGLDECLDCGTKNH